MLGTSKQNPVIGPLEIPSTIAFAQQLNDSVVDWTSGKEWSPDSCPLRGAEDQFKQWQDKFKDARYIISEVLNTRNPLRENGFVYLFNKKAIGIMTVDEYAGSICINTLVASPAASGAGCALLEAAVRWSERCGNHGNIRLFAKTPAVGEVYLRYGFEKLDRRKPTAEGRLHLTPLTSNAWEKTVDGWSIKAKIGRAYAVSGLEQSGV